LRDSAGYAKCRSWMGGKGWSGHEKKTGKLQPHLAPLLLDHGVLTGYGNEDVLAPLEAWLQTIVADAAPAPL